VRSTRANVRGIGIVAFSAATVAEHLHTGSRRHVACSGPACSRGHVRRRVRRRRSKSCESRLKLYEGHSMLWTRKDRPSIESIPKIERNSEAE